MHDVINVMATHWSGLGLHVGLLYWDTLSCHVCHEVAHPPLHLNPFGNLKGVVVPQAFDEAMNTDAGARFRLVPGF